MVTGGQELIRSTQRMEHYNIGHPQWWSSTKTPKIRPALSHSSELEQVTQPFFFLTDK